MEQKLEEVIKKAILDKKKGAYSLIVSTHYNKIIEMGNQYFVSWLCKSLEIEEGLLDHNSFATALYRYKKKRGKNNLLNPGGGSESSDQVKEFRFSDPSSADFIKKNEKSKTGRKYL